MSDATKIITRCPHCGASFKVASEHIGKKAKCAKCDERFLVEPVESLPSAKPPVEPQYDLKDDNPFLGKPEVHSTEEVDWDASEQHIDATSLPPTGLTVSEGTYASNPGNLKISYLRWMSINPLWPAIWLVLLIGSLVLVGFSPGILTGLLVLFAAVCNFFYWRRLSDLFQYGCANPSVVVALEPTLVAVSTDLSMGEGEYPVIKIIEVDLTKSAGEPLVVGSYLPTVALYDHPPNDEAEHWANFFPVPADYATGDAEKVRAIQATFSPEDLQELHAGLKHVAQPYEPGLYVLWPEEGKQLGRLADFKTED